MRIKAGRQSQEAGRGFTLVELLLTTALLMLLLGAAVFSLPSLQHGTSLDEGAAQFESLIRYARAHSASTGRQVQLTFEDSSSTPKEPVAASQIEVSWEPDPLTQPGIFARLSVARPYVDGLNDLIQVEGVRIADSANSESLKPATAQTADSPESKADSADPMPPIRFYPDGSSDSAEVVLSSRAEDDSRRLSVRLVGITGAIHRSILPEPGQPEPEPDKEQMPASSDPEAKRVAMERPAGAARSLSPGHVAEAPWLQ
ncbi:MAG: GspH/FimT family pseudopilin [Verrucomicrobia bacterium]|nr:GspH/FimT family pseudopilin [Verrucomicrobiota bacterium]